MVEDRDVTWSFTSDTTSSTTPYNFIVSINYSSGGREMKKEVPKIKSWKEKLEEMYKKGFEEGRKIKCEFCEWYKKCETCDRIDPRELTYDDCSWICEDCDALREEYDRGYDDGYEAGRTDGYDTGHDDGYEKGYEEGYRVAKEEYQIKLDEMYNEGYEIGYEEGIKDGRRNV